MYSRYNPARSLRRVMRRSRRGPIRSAYQTGNAVARAGRSYHSVSTRRPMSVRRMGSSVVLQYAKSILNPSLTGAKIPDDFAQPSSSFQLEQEYVIQCGATTSCLMALELGTLPSFMAYDRVLGAIPNKTSQFNLKKPVFLGQVSTSSGGVNDLGILLSLYKACRLVSAGIKVQFAGTDASNSGVITIAYLNREFFTNTEELGAVYNCTGSGSTSSGLTTSTTIPASKPMAPVYITAPATNTNNYWGLVGMSGSGVSQIDDIAVGLRSLPINAFGPVKDGCVGRYFPLDSTDTNFRQLATAKQCDPTNSTPTLYASSNAFAYGEASGQPLFSQANAAGGYAVTGDVVVPAGIPMAAQACNYGAFIVTCEGLNTSTPPSFVVKCTANFEGQIRDEGINLVSQARSPVVPGAVAKANKIYGKHWQCKVGTEIDSHPVR